jgi:hypothetical protein
MGVVDEDIRGGRRRRGAPPGLADPPPRTTAGQRRRRHQARLHQQQGGGCRLGETLTAPLLLLFGGAWAGWANQASAGHSQAGRPTGRTAPPFPEVRRTPLNFRKVQKKPLNFNLALRLLSFIYSDLLVLYIYNLDLKIVL